MKTEETHGYEECCEIASREAGFAGYTFEAGAKKTTTKAPEAATAKPASGITFKNSPYHSEGSEPGRGKTPFKNRDMFELTGHVTKAKGGKVEAKPEQGKASGSFLLTFGPGYAAGHNEPVTFFNVTGTYEHIKLDGRAEVVQFPGGPPPEMFSIQWHCPEGK